MRRQFDRAEVERQIFFQLGNGYNTTREIASRLKIASTTVNTLLKNMYVAGKIQRQLVGCTHYYSRCVAPAHDPFGLCQKAGGKT